MLQHHTVRVSIDLEVSPGSRTSVFTFADGFWNAKNMNLASPTVLWINKHKLSISIGAVAAVYKKVERVGDIEISYRIDHVLFEERPSTQGKH